MNFEVFDTKEQQEERAKELRAQGADVIEGYNGRTYTIKWKS